MKMFLPALLLAILVCTGCAWWRKSPPESSNAAVESSPSATFSTPVASETPKLIVTPGDELVGKVAVYNDAGRFVVLDFSIGHVPAAEQRMFVYRNGLKVGEIKITGPQRENHTVADLVAGEAQRNDEVRSK